LKQQRVIPVWIQLRNNIFEKIHFVDAYDFRFKIISSPFSNMRNAFVEATYPLGMEFTKGKIAHKISFQKCDVLQSYIDSQSEVTARNERHM